MRMMVTIRLPAKRANQAIKDGTLQDTIRGVLDRIKPECAYFLVENGRRTMRAVFDHKSPEDMMTAFQPAFLELEAEIDLCPVMTAEELALGFKSLS
jgi:hypothetical protein